MARSGNRIGDISAAVQACVEGHGYGVVRSLCGHGIGKEMHEDPEVPNFGKAGHGPRLREGMCIAVEPMITAGDYRLHRRGRLGVPDAGPFHCGALRKHFGHHCGR